MAGVVRAKDKSIGCFCPSGRRHADKVQWAMVNGAIGKGATPHPALQTPLPLDGRGVADAMGKFGNGGDLPKG